MAASIVNFADAMTAALLMLFALGQPQRTHAHVRAIYNADRHWLVLLIDYVDPRTKLGNGTVDEVYRFVGIDSTWPLGARWEGIADLDAYPPVSGRPGGLGVRAGGRFVQFFLKLPYETETFGKDAYGDAQATQLTVRDAGHASGGSGPSTVSFAEAERREVEAVEREAASLEPNTPRPSPTRSGGGTAASTPVRVGSGIIEPRKISGAQPVRPAAAVQAGVRGTVLLEVTIGVDGAVTKATVLRSVPLLDEAALDAVRQWRYEPTEINGQAVPVIVTVPVAFR
jgi:TonB family protein